MKLVWLPTSSLLSKSIEVIHCNQRVKSHLANTTFLPRSNRFDFKLTCKPEYEGNKVFKEQAAESKDIIEKAQKSLRECIGNVMDMELQGTILKLKNEYINGLLNLFECWVCYTKATDPDNVPPFNNHEGAEVLLQQYFHTKADDECFEYLYSNKNDFILGFIKPRIERISYLKNKNITPEELEKADNFKECVSLNVFGHIKKISSELLKKYNDNLNKDEAIQRTEALIRNRKSSTATEATANAIEKEDSIKAQNMMSLIDDRTTLAIKKMATNVSKLKPRNGTHNKYTPSSDPTTTSANVEHQDSTVKDQGIH